MPTPAERTALHGNSGPGTIVPERVRRSAPVLLGLLLAVASAGCGAGGGEVPPAAPAAPVPDAPSGTEVPPAEPGAQVRAARVPVVPGAVDLRPRPFDSAQPAGERQLAVRFWGGVAPCSVVGRVEVDETAERVRVTVFSGRDPAPGRVACIELAVYQEVVVELAAPLGARVVVDGAA